MEDTGRVPICSDVIRKVGLTLQSSTAICNYALDELRSFRGYSFCELHSQKLAKDYKETVKKLNQKGL